MLPLCCVLGIGLAAITGAIAPLTFTALFERKKSPAEVFTLRGKSLRFVAIWMILAIAAIVLAAFNGAVDCFEVVVAVLCGFIPVCFWRVYFENYDFVEPFVAEIKKRLRYLMREGIGMDEFRFESISSAVEKAVVEFWKEKLTKKNWKELSEEEIGELMFDASIEVATVVVEIVGEDVYWTVFAFMREWQRLVEEVRVPEKAKRGLEGRSIEQKTLNCIAVILANETRKVRETRARLSTETQQPPYAPAAKANAKKTATEAILRWPKNPFEATDVGIREIVYDTEELCVTSDGQRHVCAMQGLPECVVYTLKKMIEAGYLRITPNGKINVAIQFRNSFMVFQGKDWNSSKIIELSPFRHVTSVTAMAEGPAFVVEKREIIEGEEIVTGSQSLQGSLKLEVDVGVNEEGSVWKQHDHMCDMKCVWGRIGSFVQEKNSCLLDLPAVWLIKAVWQIFLVVETMFEKLYLARFMQGRLDPLDFYAKFVGKSVNANVHSRRTFRLH